MKVERMSSAPSLASSIQSDETSSNGDGRISQKEMFYQGSAKVGSVQPADEESRSHATDPLLSESTSTSSRSDDSSSTSSFSSEGETSEDNSADSKNNTSHSMSEESTQENRSLENQSNDIQSRHTQSTTTSNSNSHSQSQGESKNGNRSKNCSRSSRGLSSRQTTSNASAQVSKDSKSRQSRSISENQSGDRLPYDTRSAITRSDISSSSETTSMNSSRAPSSRHERRSQHTQSSATNSDISSSSTSMNRSRASNSRDKSRFRQSASVEDIQASVESTSKRPNENQDNDRLPHHAAGSTRSNASQDRPTGVSRSAKGSINADIDQESVDSKDSSSSSATEDNENQQNTRLPHHTSFRRPTPVDGSRSEDDSRTSLSDSEYSYEVSRGGDQSTNGNTSGNNSKSTVSSSSSSLSSGVDLGNTSKSSSSSHRQSSKNSHDGNDNKGSKEDISRDKNLSRDSLSNDNTSSGGSADNEAINSKEGSVHKNVVDVQSPHIESLNGSKNFPNEGASKNDIPIQSPPNALHSKPPLSNAVNANITTGKPPMAPTKNLHAVPPTGGGGNVNMAQQDSETPNREGFELVCGSVGKMSDLGDSVLPDGRRINDAFNDKARMPAGGPANNGGSPNPNVNPNQNTNANANLNATPNANRNVNPDATMGKTPVAQPRILSPVNVNLPPQGSEGINREGFELLCGSVANMSDLGDSVMPDGTRINDQFDGKTAMPASNGIISEQRSAVRQSYEVANSPRRQTPVKQFGESQSIYEGSSRLRAIPENLVETVHSEEEEDQTPISASSSSSASFDNGIRVGDIEKNQNVRDNGSSIDRSWVMKESNQEKNLEATSESDSSIDEEEGIQVPLLFRDDDIASKSGSVLESDIQGESKTSSRDRKSISRHSRLAFKFKELDPTKGECKLSESMLSFLISSSACRMPYLSAICIVVFKLSILAMLVINLTGKKLFVSEQNPLGVPISSSWPVGTCQVLALIIAVLTQDDLLTGLNLWREGNFKNAKLLVNEEDSERPFGGVSKYKWLTSIFLLSFVGLSTLVSTFLLVMTSQDVVSILLTFAIVAFISKLDNDLFALAKKGILGENIRKEVQVVTCTIYELPSAKTKSFIRSYILIIVFLFSLFTMIGAWSFIFMQQINGSYWPEAILLQLDDAHNAELGYVGGLYKLQSKPLGYTKGAASLMFCTSKYLWTIRVEGDDPCQKSIAMSSPQKAWSKDINTAAQVEWFATSEEGLNPQMYSVENVFLAEVCLSDSDCGGKERGECQKSGCLCRSGFYGIHCRFKSNETCPFLGVDEQTSIFRAARPLSSDYELLRNEEGSIILAYHHPIFIATKSKKDLDVMLFSGLRWVITSANNLIGKVNNPELELANFFEKSSFDATKHLKEVDQISSAVRVNTLSDQPAPFDLSWSPEDKFSTPLHKSGTRIICKTCDGNKNKCLNGGLCLSDGICECRNRAKGSMCQIAPLGDGNCDHPFFNTALYDFDGGDCCATTCSSATVNTCGFVSFRDRAKASYVGFPFCENPYEQGCDSSEICWSSTGEGIQYLAGGRSSGISLSANGRIMVVSEPSINSVRVFDQIANKWVQRGNILKSDAQVDFGARVATLTPPRNIVLQRAGKVPITLAIAMKEEFPAIRIYRWRALDVEWSQVCSDIVIECNGSDCAIQELSMGREGDQGVLAVALENEKVYLYQVSFDSMRCALKWTTDGTKLHVSGNGKRIAVASQRASSALFLNDIAIFDISARTDPVSQSPQGTFVVVDLDYRRDNLLSEGLIAKYTANNILALPFALGYEGSTMSIAFISSDSSILIDTFRQQDRNSLYQSIFLAPIDLTSDQLSAMQIYNKISAVRFSRDGASLGLMYDNRIHVASYKGNSNMLWALSSAPFQRSELHFDLSVSSTGIMATTDGSLVKTFTLSQKCGEGMSLILISLKLDGAPEDISWYLEHVGVDGGLVFSKRTFAGCQECYMKEFAGTDILEEVCVPKDIVNCLRLNFKSRKERSTDTVAAFADGVNFVSYNGGIGEFDFVASSNDFSFAQECRAQLFDDNNLPRGCSGEDNLLVVLVTTDLNPQETEWRLETLGSGQEVLQGGPYDMGLRTYVAADCISLDLECYVFKITDIINSDGICCNSGYGNVELFLKPENRQVYSKVYNPGGRFSAGKEQVIRFGGGCPPTNDPSRPPSTSIVFPISPFPAPIEPTLGPQMISPTQDPTSDSTLAPTSVPVSTPVTTQVPIMPTYLPISIPNSPSQAPTEVHIQIQVVITISLDDQPEEIGWVLSDNTGNQAIVAQVLAGKYTTQRGKPREFVDIETGKSYLFCITDTGGDGIQNGNFSINFKGMPILIDKGNFQEEKCHVIEISSTDVNGTFGGKE